MAYNNGDNHFVGNYGGGGFASAPYAQNGPWNNNSSNTPNGQKPYVKHSGCKTKTMKIGPGKNSGKTCVYGWNYSQRNGMVKLLATPYHKSEQYTSKNGRVWFTWILNVSKPMCEDYRLPCMFEAATGKVFCQKLGLVMNPNAPNGGYAGKFWRSKKQRN